MEKLYTELYAEFRSTETVFLFPLFMLLPPFLAPPVQPQNFRVALQKRGSHGAKYQAVGKSTDKCSGKEEGEKTKLNYLEFYNLGL